MGVGVWGRAVIAGSLALAGVMIPGSASAEAPGNDDVGSATPVTGIPFNDVVAVGEATVEDGEPTETCAPFANTVWYAVSLAAATEVFVDTAGSDYDTAVAVWLGSSFDDLELVACNDDTFAGLQAATTFTAEPGSTYLVQVGAFFEAPPDAVLTISFDEPQKPTGKPFISKDGVRGRLANANIEQFDEEAQTFSFRDVQLVDGQATGKGSRPMRVSQLNLSSYEEQFDEATETFSFTQWFGLTDLAPGEFAIDRRLNDAWVTTEMSLFGEMCTFSPEVFECTDLGEALVLVDVTWVGDGAAVRSRDSGAQSGGHARFRYRSDVTTRNAVVDGGASGDVSIDFTGASGNLVSGSNGSWSWSRGGGLFGPGDSFTALADGRLAGSQVVFDRFRGSFANAFDESYDEEVGEFSSRGVSMTLGRSKTKGGQWFRFDEVSVYSVTETFDDEAGSVTTTEWFGAGTLIDGFVDRGLGGAEALADVTLFGVTCTYLFEEESDECVELGTTTVTVDVAWEGTGETFTSRYSSDVSTSSEHLRFSGRSTSRSAIANGVVAGDLIGWTLDDADGSIARNADGSWIKM